MANQIKKPLQKGVAKVPVVMQMEALECGAACLDMIAAYYDLWIPLAQCRFDCGVSRDGSNARNMLLAARSYGFDAQGYRYEPEDLREEGLFPCIIHWNFNHFVVLDGFKGNKACLNDPACGKVTCTMEDFDRQFTGVVLMITPGENFKPGGKRDSVWDFAFQRLHGTSTAILFVAITTIIAYLFSIINPVMSQIFIDRLLTGINREWLLPFIAIMSILAIIELVSQFVSAIFSLKINGKMAAVGSTSYMWQVLRMPMTFFSQRMAGDILQRQQTNATIASALVNILAPILLNAFMMIFYLLVMIRYSLVLTLIGITTIVFNLIMSNIIAKQRIDMMRVAMRDSGNLSSTTLNGIRMIETIKAAGAENGFFAKWSGYQAALNKQMVKFNEINYVLGMIPAFISTLANYSVLFLGVYFTMQGQFTLGSIMTFQGLLSSFLAPAMTLVGASESIQEMRTDMERIEDVMKYPLDPYCVEKPLEEDREYTKLSGSLEMKDVTFGYSRLADPLITNFNLSLQRGQRIALVGTSGCGKSTIAKLIAGLYQPWSGTITFDGKEIKDIDKAVFRGSLAVVDQEIILFEDTIANNIKMWDNTIEDFEMIMAARDAQIHNDIMLREDGYQHKLTENGKDLSGGQRQRLEIARVLAQDPSIIILDEATSALDARTEYEVVKAIKDRGITCIVVAHRLSTIRDCDEIIVLDQGKVVERGTHKELYALNGYYTELVSSD